MPRPGRGFLVLLVIALLPVGGHGTWLAPLVAEDGFECSAPYAPRARSVGDPAFLLYGDPDGPPRIEKNPPLGAWAGEGGRVPIP